MLFTVKMYHINYFNQQNKKKVNMKNLRLPKVGPLSGHFVVLKWPHQIQDKHCYKIHIYTQIYFKFGKSTKKTSVFLKIICISQ